MQSEVFLTNKFLYRISHLMGESEQFMWSYWFFIEMSCKPIDQTKSVLSEPDINSSFHCD